ncbi:hypothetical protein SCUP515_06093 [Seiridium cupressi]
MGEKQFYCVWQRRRRRRRRRDAPTPGRLAYLPENAQTMWVLIPVSYLCEGFDTPSDEVFFLKEFRDDSLTTKSTREEYARAAILNHLNQSRQSGCNEDVIWTFPPEKDFADEILSGIALYNISGHRGALEAVRHKTTNALNDGHLPIEQNENVMAILNWHKYLKNTTFDVEMAL